MAGAGGKRKKGPIIASAAGRPGTARDPRRNAQRPIAAHASGTAHGGAIEYVWGTGLNPIDKEVV
jgi:hypothetical protein